MCSSCWGVVDAAARVPPADAEERRAAVVRIRRLFLGGIMVVGLEMQALNCFFVCACLGVPTLRNVVGPVTLIHILFLCNSLLSPRAVAD